jgi:23S rRNA (cytidine2498-2'-O)-methyltransferase
MTYAILTCSEHFTDLALNELQRQHSNLTLVKQVSPQHLFLKAPTSFDNLTRPWRNQLPIYLHHLFPVHQTLSLTGTPSDFDCLRKQAQALCRKDYLVQARVIGDYPYSAITLEQFIHPAQPVSTVTKTNGRILSLLVVDKCAYIGISWASQNLSPFASGRPYFDEPLPNRAGFKLLEALDAFDIRLRPGDHALDLGAAPGAWTAVLVRRGMRVTAVAPRAMYDWLQIDPNVRATCLTAEEYLPTCDTTYDLIVNDMKLDAQDSARLMTEYAVHLRPQGIAIMTLKLRLRNPRRLMDHAFRLLRKEYKIIRVRQLVGNRKEVTLFLRRHD